MLEKSQRFFDHLDRYAESGEEFGLGELATNLAFDVIGKQRPPHACSASNSMAPRRSHQVG